MADAPAVYDHYRPSGADYPDGVYRVVGASADDVTLLRVGDADGRRRHTGEVVSVPTDVLSDFETAENPDGNQSAGDAVRSALQNLYWSSRAFVQSLAAHPVASALALAVLLAGEFGQEALSLSGLQAGLLIVVGGLALVYVGSGRF